MQENHAGNVHGIALYRSTMASILDKLWETKKKTTPAE
jgi:hypothetical protein